MAYYLKYRPKTIGELDLVDVREKLINFLVSGELPHALLFTGTRGIGKTSSARIWAKAVNCEKRTKKNEILKQVQDDKLSRGDVEPCGECDACNSIANGTSMDIIEMDAASNRGIDDVRLLREKIKLSPTKLTYKVYIIDEIHMLTKEAFNALLKTLEEPPKHAMFVLCTTDPEKLPQTIVSRCIQINFRRATDKELVSALQRVVLGEKLQVEDGVLDLIARLANGSFRDATKFLEEAVSGGKNIKLVDFEQKVGMGASVWDKFDKFIESKDGVSLVNWVEEQVENGVDIKNLAGQIIIKLHSKWLKMSVQERDSIFKLLGLIDDYWWRFNTSLLPHLPLELAFCEWVNSFKGNTNISDSEKVQEQQSIKEEMNVKVEIPKIVSPEKDVEVVNPVIKRTIDLMFVSDVQMKWDRLLGWVKDRNVSVEALLRAAKPIEMENNCLVLEVAYPFHKEKLLVDANRRIVEAGLSELLGTEIKVDFLLRSGGKVKNNEQDVSIKMPYVSVNVDNVREDVVSKDSRKKVSTEMPAVAEDDELMKLAEEIFGK